jgi:hypothetical protein
MHLHDSANTVNGGIDIQLIFFTYKKSNPQTKKSDKI